MVISSHARTALEMRGPHDIINFASLLGLTEADAKVVSSLASFHQRISVVKIFKLA